MFEPSANFKLLRVFSLIKISRIEQEVNERELAAILEFWQSFLCAISVFPGWRGRFWLTVEVADGLAVLKKCISDLSIKKRNHTASLCGVGGTVGHCNLLLCDVGALSVQEIKSMS